MLYLFNRAKRAIRAFSVLFVLAMSVTAQASVITLDKVSGPANELAAVKYAFQNYGGSLDFDYTKLLYLGKFDTENFVENIVDNKYPATAENTDTPDSIFTLTDLKFDSSGDLWKASVEFGPELMIALLVVDGDNIPTYLYFDNMFSGVTVYDANKKIYKGISHFTAFGYLEGGSGIPSMVPVPAALPLFGTGLAVMGFLSWRRKRKLLSIKKPADREASEHIIS